MLQQSCKSRRTLLF